MMMPLLPRIVAREEIARDAHADRERVIELAKQL
jgi:hypothetical protein